MYDLIIFRHGEAQERGRGADETRALTGPGKAEVRRVARGLRRLGVSPELVLTSPLVRAEETAKIAADILKPEAGLRICDALAPGGTHAALFKEISSLGRSSLMLVGHQPDLGELAGVLVWGSPTGAISFKKAGAARITTAHLPPAATGELRWLLTPKQLVLIAGEEA